jgi:hypothetical protein
MRLPPESELQLTLSHSHSQSPVVPSVLVIGGERLRNKLLGSRKLGKGLVGTVLIRYYCQPINQYLAWQ